MTRTIKYLVLGMALCFCPLTLLAQNSTIDSLLKILVTEKEDTNKVNTLNELSYSLLRIKSDSVLYYVTLAKKLSKDLKFDNGFARAKLYDATLKESIGQYAQAYILAIESKKIFQELQNELFTSKCFRRIGEILVNQENYGDALENYFQALNIAEKIKDSLEIIRSLRGISDVFLDQNNFEKALEYSLKRKEIVYKMNNLNWNEFVNKHDKRKSDMFTMDVLHEKDMVTEQLGHIYESLGNFDKSLEHHSESLHLSELQNDSKGIADSYNDMGRLYNRMGQFDKADSYYRNSEKTYYAIGDTDGVAMTIFNLGMNYLSHEKADSAIKCYFEALSLSEMTRDTEGIADCYSNIGRGYLSLNKYDSALNYMKKHLELSLKIKSAGKIQDGYENLSKVYEKLNKPVEALYNYKLFIQIRDSIAKKKESYNLLKLEAKRNFNKIVQENKIQQAQQQLNSQIEVNKKTTQRNYLIGGFFIMIIIAGMIYRNFVIKKRDNQIIIKEKNRSEELLLNILPYEVAQELKQTGQCQAKTYSMVTVMFADFKDFTRVSEKVSAELLVDEINFCFSAFDNILQKHKVEKIKTVGDAYMCASGLPVLNYTHAVDLVSAAIEIRNFMLNRKKEKEAKGEIPFEIRIGIHTGPVVAGIVGVKKFAYDIWGDTVNIASRIESSGEAGKVNISENTYELVKDKFACTHRGKIEAKHKGEIDMYFAENIS